MKSGPRPDGEDWKPYGKLVSSAQVYVAAKYFAELADGRWIALSQLPIDCDCEDLLKQFAAKGIQCIEDQLGNYCGVYSEPDRGLTVFRDVCSSSKLYYQDCGRYSLISSNWRDPLFTYGGQVSKPGLDACLLYRVQPCEHTLLTNLSGLAVDSCLCICPEGKFQQRSLNRYQPLRRPHASSYSDQQLKDEIKQNILLQYQRAYTQHKEVAVLLSGGVDSFLLCALAQQVFDRVLAYTPYWKEGSNPELERAKQLAAAIGVEQRLVEFDPVSVPEVLSRLVNTTGGAVRNFSSIVLDTCIQRLASEHGLVVYGEYADTLFGSNTIRRCLIDSRYTRILNWLIPNAVTPLIRRIGGKFRVAMDLRESSPLQKGLNLFACSDYQGFSELLQRLGLGHGEPTNVFAWSEPMDEQMQFYRCQEMALSLDVYQHMVEIESSASHWGVKVLTPFSNQEMLQLSSKLSYVQYFGRSELSVFKNFRRDTSLEVKPLLRELACEFCSPSLIYARKYGFNVPFSRWLAEPLAESVAKLVEQGWLSERVSSPYSEHDCERLWTLLCLNIQFQAMGWLGVNIESNRDTKG
ncbi:asparagine synthetase B family protein [Aliagarivorans marinus]|uniref:asparagine synthase-related protein n=1 Tax=Aliagarivorans marinus TaxID=561965 RepID=UPI00146F9741|nr:asparagine synthetase B family protein [Aliagarivorans marinus]